MKYAITSNILTIDDRDFFQVKALKDFGSVKAGDLGGYIQSSENLSQEGNCWIGQDVVLMDDARVEDNATIMGDSAVRNNAVVRGNAFVKNASVCDNAVVEGRANVIGGHFDYNSIVIQDNAVVRGELYGSFVICGDAVIESGIDNHVDMWIGANVSDDDHLITYTAPKGTEYAYAASITAYSNKDVWMFRHEQGVIELTSREIDSLLPELVGPKFATYMQFIRDAHHSIYDIELFEDDFE